MASLLALLAIGLSLFQAVHSFDLVLEIKPEKQEVIYEKSLYPDAKLFISYHSTSGDVSNVEMRVTDANGRLMVSNSKKDLDEDSSNSKDDREFSFKLEKPAVYTVTFSSRSACGIVVTSILEEGFRAGIDSVLDCVVPVQNALEELKTKIGDLIQTLKKIRNRESQNHYLTESIQSSIWWSFIFTSVSQIATGILSIYALQQFFIRHRPKGAI